MYGISCIKGNYLEKYVFQKVKYMRMNFGHTKFLKKQNMSHS